MDKILGSSLLANVETDDITQTQKTERALQTKDIILLYFSASWCAPCKTFTPQLKAFYQTCCLPNNVEIVYIPSDNNESSFLKYYGQMPWKSLPYNKESALIKQKLAESLNVVSIPTVIALDKDGMYIANDCKYSISNLSQSTLQGSNLIKSWKSAKSVPIENVNLSFFSSIASSVSRGFQIFSSSPDDDDMEVTDDTSMDESKEIQQSVVLDAKEEESDQQQQAEQQQKQSNSTVPIDFFLNFFTKAVDSLKRHPEGNLHQLIMTSNDNINDETKFKIFTPISLLNHRQLLLRLQRKVLEEEFQKCKLQNNFYNMKIEDVEKCLKNLGDGNFDELLGSKQEMEDIIKLMDIMNDEARIAFSKSVLLSECLWDDQFEDGEHEEKIKFGENARCLIKKHDKTEEMNRNTILEFCGLLSATVRIPEVQTYISEGGQILPSRLDHPTSTDQKQFPQDRILKLQSMMFRAVGYDPDFGSIEFNNVTSGLASRVGQDAAAEDEYLLNTLRSMIHTIRHVTTNAEIAKIQKKDLTDTKKGGFTSVVSVKYSERVMNKDGKIGIENEEVTQAAEMDHQSDARQRHALLMAKEAAALQQSVLGELLSMNEEEREAKLREAKLVQDEFLQEANQIPAGIERIKFIQSIGAEKQKKLVMHKLWQQLLAQNGGKAPTMV
mmetsp:Transcript_4372/g.6148  ORF Transcript_4372/g.6148 Transcript_4372/m.6148 type:complete len:668 (+) Transcript_4372:18-2021(+)